MKQCRIEGCIKPVKKGRTVCCMHDNRYRRHGSYGITKILPRNATKEQIIAKYLSSPPNENGCVETTSGVSPFGYGRVHYNGRSYFAHRFIYEYHYGEIMEDLVICHKCDNPKCVNIDHLFVGTHYDNVHDKISKGREVILKGSQCGRAKLNEEKVLAIRQDLRKYKDIALYYGVSLITIKEIRTRKTWRHI